MKRATRRMAVWAVILSVGWLCFGAASATAQEVTRGMGDARLYNRHADPTAEISSANVDQLEFAWSVETEEEVSHRPLMLDGVVYFADWGGNVYAVDARTGDIMWETKVIDQVKDSGPGTALPARA